MVDVFDRHGVRFDPRLAGCSKFVRYSDFAELAAENERLKREVENWKTSAAGWQKIANVDAEALASTGAVKVKALEWARGWMDAEAQTEVGLYTITYRRDGSFEWGIGILKGWASSWDEAKAAAQADFDRRILSAIEPHPRDTNTVEDHETANVSDKPEGQQETAAFWAAMEAGG